MAIVTLGLTQCINWNYKKARHEPRTEYLSKEHTYICILSVGYDDYANAINKYFNIIWKSRLAVNNSEDHGDKPRNQVVIFELKDNFDYSHL